MNKHTRFLLSLSLILGICALPALSACNCGSSVSQQTKVALTVDDIEVDDSFCEALLTSKKDGASTKYYASFSNLRIIIKKEINAAPYLSFTFLKDDVPFTSWTDGDSKYIKYSPKTYNRSGSHEISYNTYEKISGNPFTFKVEIFGWKLE